MATDFSIVLRHCRWWRGNVHKWSTVYPLVNTAEGASMTTGILHNFAAYESDMCWFGPLSNQGALYRADFYSKALGGAPILSATFADEDNPASGTLESGGFWGSEGRDADPVAETALVLRWASGYGRTGKPVYFRKFLHAVPVSSAVGGAPDVTSGAATGIADGMLAMRSLVQTANFDIGNTRRLAGPEHVELYYGNHQMPRGRRLKKLTTTIVKPGSYVVVSPPSE